MNSNTSSTGRERRDRPGFGWAGRSAALALWIISVLLWCVLMRQSFNAMPWDEMTVAGTRLHEWRKPFAAAGMAVGVIGTGKIGQTVIRHLSGFGCKLYAYDLYQNDEVKQYAQYVSLEEIYRN